MKYIGKCQKHGLVAHDATKAQMDINGGPFCPYCALPVEVISSDKKEPKKK